MQGHDLNVNVYLVHEVKLILVNAMFQSNKILSLEFTDLGWNIFQSLP